MRAGEGQFVVSRDGAGSTWNIGRDPGQAWPKRGWGTDFSCFRFAVPELMNFEGRAVYLDADMLLLGDIYELAKEPLGRPWKCCHYRRTDVSVIDCAAFKDRRGWLTIAQMKAAGAKTGHYCHMLHSFGLVDDTLSWDFNACDDHDQNWRQTTKLLHFTNVMWQPYRPYQTVQYQPHPFPRWAEKWFAEFEEAKLATP